MIFISLISYDINLLGLIALVISMVSLMIHFKNRVTNLKSYSITEESHQRTSFEFMLINSKIIDDNRIVKLAVFNPSSTSLFLNCLKLYKLVQEVNNTEQESEWEQVEISWFPTNEAKFKEHRLLQDEYKNLLVKDIKNIFVIIPNTDDKVPFKFELMTSHGETKHITTIHGSDYGFNIDYFKRENN